MLSFNEAECARPHNVICQPVCFRTTLNWSTGTENTNSKKYILSAILTAQRWRGNARLEGAESCQNPKTPAREKLTHTHTHTHTLKVTKLEEGDSGNNIWSPDSQIPICTLTMKHLPIKSNDACDLKGITVK